ncbi:MAG: hypothetical protein RL757_1754 [Bacteroidota bacterium]|jgi:hypothetical protein
MKNIISIIFIFIGSNIAFSQNYQFGIKGGPSMGTQSWNGGGASTNSQLWAYNTSVFVESGDVDVKSRLYAQLGWHVRGSATRFNRTAGYTTTGELVEIPSSKLEYRFNNLSLEIGARRNGIKNNSNSHIYYLVGIRADYTISTNLAKEGSSYYYFSAMQDAYVRKFNYGLTIGGGYDFRLNDMIGGFLELTIMPDLSKQYYTPPSPRVWDPFNRQYYSVGEQSIKNTTIELSLGFRFLRKIEYVD